MAAICHRRGGIDAIAMPYLLWWPSNIRMICVVSLLSLSCIYLPAQSSSDRIDINPLDYLSHEKSEIAYLQATMTSCL